MATQYVSGTYQSYKAGTGKVLRWLYENALKCGYSAKQTEDGEGEEASSKGNLRSNKKGKGNKSNAGASAKAGSAPKYVPVAEFTALAEAGK